MADRVTDYAKKSFLALLNPAGSVRKVFPNKIDFINQETGFYMGIKEVKIISAQFIERLESLGYYHHTIDSASLAGRGIDLDLTNPLTGRPMTGSSSGTAINVFLTINDIGIGTDGGGSVLAPALSLNLFGFIHPDFGNIEKKEVKVSTDGITFTPSLGVITKKLCHLTNLLTELLPLEKSENQMKIALDDECLQLEEKLFQLNPLVSIVDIRDKYELERSDLIARLTHLLNEYDMIISKEGPVDVTGFGESVFGNFDARTKQIQINANKGFLRVVNMVGAIGLTVPTSELGTGYLLICQNKPVSLERLLQVAKLFEGKENPLATRYFGNINNYFENGV